jgi:hypothetical protein
MIYFFFLKRTFDLNFYTKGFLVGSWSAGLNLALQMCKLVLGGFHTKVGS